MVAEQVTFGQRNKRPDYLKTARALAKEGKEPLTMPIPNPETARERSLRAVEARRTLAQKRFEEKMAEPVTSHKPHLIEIRAGDVQFDPRYQTDDRYDESRARKMAETWDWKTPNLAITVNIRPDDLNQTPWCPDGRHRTNAVMMRFGPDQLIPAQLHRVSYQEEAAMFAHQDENRKRVSEALKFNAGKEAEEAASLEAQEILDRLGVTLGLQAAHRCMATRTFLELVRTKGPAVTEEALRLILERYDGQRESMEAAFVKGVVFFLHRYQSDPNFTTANLRKVFEKSSPQRLVHESTKYRINGEHKRIAAAIADTYNWKRSHKLPEWGVK